MPFGPARTRVRNARSRSLWARAASAETALSSVMTKLYNDPCRMQGIRFWDGPTGDRAAHHPSRLSIAPRILSDPCGGSIAQRPNKARGPLCPVSESVYNIRIAIDCICNRLRHGAARVHLFRRGMPPNKHRESIGLKSISVPLVRFPSTPLPRERKRAGAKTAHRPSMCDLHEGWSRTRK